MVCIIDNIVPKSAKINVCVNLWCKKKKKNKINVSKQILKSFKNKRDPTIKARINQMNNEIKRYFYENKSKQIRRTIKRNVVKIVKYVKNLSAFPKITF
jgi:hypothetical protein